MSSSPAVSRLIDALEAHGCRVRSSGRGWTARCPAHDDRNPSLTINEGNDGALLKCHAGCATDAILHAIGLERRDLFNPESRGDRFVEITRYPYEDADGNLLYYVVRYLPKTFRLERTGADGRTVHNAEGVERVPYRLPQLQGQSEILIVEGEKDADNLWRVGIPATTNAGGAKKWTRQLTDHVRLAGAESVVILPDNDEIGREHAEIIAREFARAGIPVKIVSLPGLPPKGDVSDWLASGGTAESLRAIVADTPERDRWQLLNGGATESASAGAPAETCIPLIRTLADVVPEAVSWLWQDRIPRGKLTLISGEPGIGKSSITTDLVARVTSGIPLPTGEVVARGNALLLSAEDDAADTIRPRLDRFGGDPNRVGLLTAIRDKDRDRMFCLERDLPPLERAIRDREPAIVVIDPITAYLAGIDVYKDAAVRSVLAPLAALAARFEAAILLVNHPSKAERENPLYKPGGSIGFIASVRTAFSVRPHPADKSRRVLESIKNNLGPLAPHLSFSMPDGRIAWDPEPVDAELLTFSRQSSESRRRSARLGLPEACDFLREALADGPRASKDVTDEALALGYSGKTLERARTQLRIESRQFGFKGPHYMMLPGHTPPIDTSPEVGDLSLRGRVNGDSTDDFDDDGPSSVAVDRSSECPPMPPLIGRATHTDRPPIPETGGLAI